MSNYRRIHIPGGTYFFTVITFDRAPFLCDLTARRALREAIQKTRLKRPFQIEAWVLLPDHFHCMLTLPEKQENYSAIIKSIKSAFTRNAQTFGYRQENKRLSKSRAKK